MLLAIDGLAPSVVHAALLDDLSFAQSSTDPVPLHDLSLMVTQTDLR